MIRICAFTVAFFLITLFANAQTPQKKSFLGAYWSTKPDTAVKRRKSLIFGDFGIAKEFINYRNLPWYSYGLKPPIIGATEEVYFGDANKIAIGIPLFGKISDNGSYDYNVSGISHTAQITNLTCSGGVTLCRNLFARSSGFWLQSIMLSSGIIYQYGYFGESITDNSAIETTYNNYYYNNIAARAEIVIGAPIGLYSIGKHTASTMMLNTLILKIGYDYAFGYAHWQNPGEFGNVKAPAWNTGGFYVELEIRFLRYQNKEMWRKEKEKDKTKQ